MGALRGASSVPVACSTVGLTACRAKQLARGLGAPGPALTFAPARVARLARGCPGKQGRSSTAIVVAMKPISNARSGAYAL
jgi:hypothetical protein